MTNCIIELNDSEVRVYRGGDIVLRSPGFAYLVNDEIKVGHEAAKHARLRPQAVYDRFWKNLNQEALPYPSSVARHNADLAYAHLLAIHEESGKPDEIAVTVPGSFENDALSLLLGLIEASPLQAVAIVDTATAACAATELKGKAVYLDIHLHQLIVSELSIDAEVQRNSIQLLDDVGLRHVYDAIANTISDLFVKESRFDPQLHPESEQALYDQIPACLDALLLHDEVTLEIHYQDTQHRAKLKLETLVETLTPLYEKIVSVSKSTPNCFISEQMSNLPGIKSALPDAITIPFSNIYKNCLSNSSILHSAGGAVNYITSFPSNPVSTPAVAPENKQADEQITQKKAPQISHVLLGHKAYPLKHELKLSASGLLDSDVVHCVISNNDNHVQLEPVGELTVFVNGHHLQGKTVLNAGDIISFTGSKTEYTLIHVDE